jgi:hypothetical protein
MTYDHLPLWLTLAEAREVLRCSRTTLWRLVHQGSLVQLEIGPDDDGGGHGGARITRDSLVAYMTRREIVATPPGGLPLGAVLASRDQALAAPMAWAVVHLDPPVANMAPPVVAAAAWRRPVPGTIEALEYGDGPWPGEDPDKLEPTG